MNPFFDAFTDELEKIGLSKQIYDPSMKPERFGQPNKNWSRRDLDTAQGNIDRYRKNTRGGPDRQVRATEGVQGAMMGGLAGAMIHARRPGLGAATGAVGGGALNALATPGFRGTRYGMKRREQLVNKARAEQKSKKRK